MAADVVPPVRFGVLGCADIAVRRVLPALARAPGTEIAAVASRDPRKAGRLAEEYRCDAVAGYERLLERPDIEAVYVPLPASLHAPWVARGLRAGKHVLGEKPLTSALASTVELVSLARSRGLVLMENITFLHHAQHARVRELLAEGAIGRLRSMSAAFAIPPLPRSNIRYEPLLDGGSLLDVGVHPLRAVQFFLGPELEVLGSSLRLDPACGVDVAGAALLRAPDGVTAQVTFGMEHAYRSQYELWGSEGRIRVELALTPAPGIPPKVCVERDNEARELRLEPDNQYANTVQAFAGAVRSGTAGPWGEEAVALAALVDAVRRGAR